MKVDRDNTNRQALDNPAIGDFWFERVYCPYFLVVGVNGDDITVLSCLGGPDSYNRKTEVNAKVDNRNGTWSFDYDKTMIVNREWIRKTVTYDSVAGFVADVRRSGRENAMYKEWVRSRVEKIRDELDALGPDASIYMLQKDQHDHYSNS